MQLRAQRFRCDLDVTFQIFWRSPKRSMRLRTVDADAITAYLPTQARPGDEARLTQQPRHQLFNIQPVCFLKPVFTTGQLPIQHQGQWSTQRK